MGARNRVAPDVVDLLRSQHGQIRRGFLAAMLPGSGRQRRFDHLRRLLAVHEAAEEAHVHPVVRKAAEGGRTLMRKRLAEERVAKKLLKDLERTGGPGNRGFLRKLLALEAAVLMHARHEEREEFPVLRRSVRAARRRSLGAESKLTQRLAPTRAHPLVNSQLTAKLTAPVLGPVDRTRDLARALIRH